MKRFKISIILVILSVLIFGCTSDDSDTEYIPDMDLSLDKKSISVNSGTTGTATLTLVKKDSINIQTSFVIELVSPEVENIYFVDVDGNKITTINTPQFENKGDKKVYPFAIKARKDSSKNYVSYILNFRLLYNGKEIGRMQELKVKVI